MKPARRLALFATILGSGVVFLDGSVVNLALPKIAADLHAPFSSLQWIVDGYLLTLASLMLLGGSLDDILGTKKMYVIGLAGFGFFSLLCGLAPNVDALIVSRMFQGIFGALLVPGSLAIINTNFPLRIRGKEIGEWAAWTGAFSALGPLLGGYLIDIGSWRWIFFINIPLIILCLLLTLKDVKETRPLSRQIDFKGAALIALSLAGITYGLIEGPAMNWSAIPVASLVGGLLVGLIFLIYESKSKTPLVNLDLFESRNFAGANAMTLAMYGALSGFMFALVIYLQTKMGYSAIKAGVSLLPVTILLLFLSGKVGGLSSKYGPRLFMTVGPILAGIGILSLLNLKPGDNYATFLLPRVILFGAGLALMVAPLTTTVMTSVQETSSGIASAINNVVSRVAGLVVIALLGLLGTQHVYKFSMALCGILAVCAGIISLVFIRNPQKVVARAKV
jgi:EmrB/QacA subfamily drug resistance transporter